MRREQHGRTRQCRVVARAVAWWLPAAMAGVVALAVVGSAHQHAIPSEDRAREYRADVPKTILELQQFRLTQSIRIRSKAGREGVATLVNLNPAINAWYLLEVTWSDRHADAHLSPGKPESARSNGCCWISSTRSGLVVAEGADRYPCDLFSAGPPDVLEQGRSSGRIFAPLCESRLYLRNPGKGRHTALEAATDFLRDRVWGGEEAIALGHHLLGDANRETGTDRQGCSGCRIGSNGRTAGPAGGLD